MFTSNVQFGYPCPRGGGKLQNIGKQKEQLKQLVKPLPNPPMSDGNKMRSWCMDLSCMLLRITEIL